MNCVNRKAKGLVLVFGVVIAATCFSVTSCGTANGFGSDVKTAGRGVEHAGQAIKNTAER